METTTDVKQRPRRKPLSPLTGCLLLFGLGIFTTFCVWPASVGAACPVLAQHYSQGGQTMYPNSELVKHHTGAYTGSGGIEYLWFYRSSDELETVASYYDTKIGTA